jgi:hypothetical protein
MKTKLLGALSVIVIFLNFSNINFSFAEAGPDQGICQGDKVKIGDPAVHGMSYSWSPSEGLNYDNIAQPFASPANTTTYVLTETNKFSGISTTDTVIVTVYPGLKVMANAGKNKKLCTGGDCKFIGAPPVPHHIYSWSPATGLSSTTDSRPMAHPEVTTTYILTETDTLTGCVGIDSVKIFVIQTPEANAGPDQYICEGDSILIGSPYIPGNTYSWSPSTGLSSDNSAQTMAGPSSTTTYILTVTDSFGCKDSDTVTVYVNPLPTADAGNDKTHCPDACKNVGSDPIPGYTYSWSPTDGLTDPTASKTMAHPDSTTTYVVTVTDTATGCQATDTTIVYMLPGPDADAGEDKYICQGGCVIIGTPAVDGLIYCWTPATGLNSNSKAQPMASPSETTTYILTVKDTISGCKSMDTVIVYVNPLPTADAGNDKTHCPDACKNVGSDPIPGYTYSWSPTDGLTDPTASKTMAHPDSTTTYVVTVTDTATGCQATDTTIVYMLPGPDADAGEDKYICQGGCVFIGTPAVDGLIYCWTPATGLNSNSKAQPMASPSETTIYILTVKDTVSGCKDKDTVIVYVNPGPVCEIGTPDPADLICNHGNYTISTSVDASLYDLEWTMSVDGNPDGWAIIGSNTGQTITFSSGNCGAFGFQVHFDLKVTSKTDTACNSSCSASFSPRAPQCVVDIRPPVEFNCSVSSQYLLASYQTDIMNPNLEWTKNGVSIGSGISNGSNLDSILITMPGIYQFIVSDSSDNSCFAEVIVTEDPSPCDSNFCSLTQGFYGSGQGTACATGEQGEDLIYRLLGSPFGDLVIGKTGQSLTIEQMHSHCITTRMPAGGTAQTLPMGDQAFDMSCTTTIPINKNGRFDNVLLGQTIALGLNMRLDIELVSLSLQGTSMITMEGDAGDDGICGTADDVPVPGSSITKSIPQTVLDALDAIYVNRSVENLFDLANRALGGQSTGSASLSEVNDAVSAINEGFDGCRFLEGFDSIQYFKLSNMTDFDQKNLYIKAYPNPFTFSTTIQFTSPTDEYMNVIVYDRFGAKVSSLFAGNVSANHVEKVIFNSDNTLSNGVYFLVVTSENNSSGIRLLLLR